MKGTKEILDRRAVPFVMVTRKVIEDESLRAADKSIYATLCMYADNRTSDCYPSRDTLINKAGVSDKTLRKSLQVLMERGYIDIINRYTNDGRQLSNLFVLLDV